MNKSYEAPSVIDLGSVAEVTLGEGSNVPDALALATGDTLPIS